ncbi:bifunctional diguanylate cyclase/phosphodiesterase [Cucumibacter marinus]|uniref:bifunctional diguanylate cyclase/phosphodiesterase n=1 Tax=Cucumibacter marinus TaxID=1121252 RepID=UPI0012DE1040|nr:EAL domain-containing protein [Cucumibacter marinus]
MLAFVARPSYIPALITLFVVIAAGVYSDRQNVEAYRHNQRHDVSDKLNSVRSDMEDLLNTNIHLAWGLVGAIAAEPQLNQPRFERLARSILRQNSGIRHIAVAPDLVVRYIYPLKGNEAAVGLDYRANDEQRDAALKVRYSGEAMMAGPIKLVQGGDAFVVRYPVFVENSGKTQFWGLVASVIDIDKVYREAGLLDPELGIDIAITGNPAIDEGDRVFFGNENVVTGNPVKGVIGLPTGSWTMYAKPKTGWHTLPPYIWGLRAIILIAGIAVVLPILVTGHLVEERWLHIRELRRREAQLQRLSYRLEMALDASKVGVWEYELDTGALVWDDRMNELYGLPLDGGARSYRHWRAALHPDDLEQAEADFRNSLETHQRYHSQFRVLLKDGRVRHIRAIAEIYVDPEGPTRLVGVNWDVTADMALNQDLKRAKALTEARNSELEAAKARIEHDALHDALTGLPNRRFLDEMLEFHASECAARGGRLAVLHIDLDRFKQINDTLGHAAGDAMLIHASEVLKSNIRESDFVARIGGDEFVVVCRSMKSVANVEGLAERAIEQMRRPVQYEGHECRTGISVGIAAQEGDDIDPKRLLINADIALYRAKSRGRNRFEVFTEALQAEIVFQKHRADDILIGLEQQQFVAYYQPQICARTFDIAGFEALARWKHPAEGVLTPDKFLGIAEELNVVATIDGQILEQSIEDSARWRNLGFEIPKVSVNVSARRLHDERLIASLRELDFKPGTVSFELVESIFLDERDEVVGWNIDQLNDLGIDIEIDDFGTGHASIISLLQIKPKRLKIDRRFVTPIVEHPGQRHLVESIVEIGKSLNIEVVAEGVETMEHARILSDLGCDTLQGYVFARPIPAEMVPDFLTQETWRKAS